MVDPWLLACLCSQKKIIHKIIPHLEVVIYTTSLNYFWLYLVICWSLILITRALSTLPLLTPANTIVLFLGFPDDVTVMSSTMRSSSLASVQWTRPRQRLYLTFSWVGFALWTLWEREREREREREIPPFKHCNFYLSSTYTTDKISPSFTCLVEVDFTDTELFAWFVDDVTVAVTMTMGMPLYSSLQIKH